MSKTLVIVNTRWFQFDNQPNNPIPASDEYEWTRSKLAIQLNGEWARSKYGIKCNGRMKEWTISRFTGMAQISWQNELTGYLNPCDWSLTAWDRRKQTIQSLHDVYVHMNYVTRRRQKLIKTVRIEQILQEIFLPLVCITIRLNVHVVPLSWQTSIDLCLFLQHSIGGGPLPCNYMVSVMCILPL